MSSPLPSAFDLERLRGVDFVRHVVFHSELPSTNDHALGLAEDPGLATPLLVLAEQQTAGRGRGANRWWHATGGLTFSLVIDTRNLAIPTRLWPKVALTSGLAVCESLAGRTGKLAVRLKWPNDVYLEGRKICGILVEVPHRAEGRVVIGVGVNVNNSLREAPEELQQSATSLVDHLGPTSDVTDLLVEILASLGDYLESLGRGEPWLVERWRSRCLLTGRTVTVRLGPREVTGQCGGIDDDGALIVNTPLGIEHCFAGTVALSDENSIGEGQGSSSRNP